MNNPFDAAIPAMIECYEDNYRNGFIPPRYPVPAIPLNVFMPWDWNWDIDWLHWSMITITDARTHKIVAEWQLEGYADWIQDEWREGE